MYVYALVYLLIACTPDFFSYDTEMFVKKNIKGLKSWSWIAICDFLPYLFLGSFGLITRV